MKAIGGVVGEKHPEETVEVVRLLVDARAELNYQGGPLKSKTTALIIAAQHCRPTLVEILLQAGADPERKDKEGMTALQYVELTQKNQDQNTPEDFKVRVQGCLDLLQFCRTPSSKFRFHLS